MPAPILYSFRRCPYAMRARLAIVAGNARVELREVALRDKPREMLDASPKGTIPVLILPDGTVIDESLDIMRWALAAGSSSQGTSDPALIAANDGGFKYHLDRYKYADRHVPDGVDHRAVATGFLERLDRRLDGRPNLDGDRVSITDLAIMPFVRQFAEADRTYFDAVPLGRVQAWLARHLSSALFATIMVRMDPWRPGDPPTPFPPIMPQIAPTP